MGKEHHFALLATRFVGQPILAAAAFQAAFSDQARPSHQARNVHKRVGRTPGRTPWSARVPLDPLFAELNQPHTIPERPSGSAVDPGVCPTICAEWSPGSKVSDIGLPSCGRAQRAPLTGPPRGLV